MDGDTMRSYGLMTSGRASKGRSGQKWEGGWAVTVSKYGHTEVRNQGMRGKVCRWQKGVG